MCSYSMLQCSWPEISVSVSLLSVSICLYLYFLLLWLNSFNDNSTICWSSSAEFSATKNISMASVEWLFLRTGLIGLDSLFGVSQARCLHRHPSFCVANDAFLKFAKISDSDISFSCHQLKHKLSMVIKFILQV